MRLNELAPKLPAESYEKNFADIAPPLNEMNAPIAASQCLYCFDAPCITACPTHIDIPSFIKKIATGNLRGSARVILDANPMGASCARACPVEVLCEGACVMGTDYEPVQIALLQRYAMDYVQTRQSPLFQPGAPNGKRVAIIGAGPAGLSCAFYLARWGYAVTIFEKRPLPGGLNTYGIAEYKMTQRTALEEVELVRQLGVEIRTGVAVGAEITREELEHDFAAIFLGVGLGRTSRLGIEGEDLPGCLEALEFIEQVKTRRFDEVEIGRSVAVIGAGNTSIDAVTQAKRLGAERVIMIYRRSAAEMPAYEYEFELAKKDGIEFMWLTAPTRIIGVDRVEGLECVRMALGEPDASGRRSPAPVTGSEFVLNVDMVIKALGQLPIESMIDQIPGLKFGRKRTIAIDPASGQTGNPKYFAGGDCVSGGKEIVNAAQEGKVAAHGIHAYLSGAEEVKVDPRSHLSAAPDR